MMYAEIQESLRRLPRRWLVTGAAGFIGSHLVQELLQLRQDVTGLDNFATGHRRNLDDLLAQVGPENARRFTFVEGDIRDVQDCERASKDVHLVLHQAALGSVPRSLEDPRATHRANVDGFVNVMLAARDAGVKRLVYASSSSVYGDHPALPKREDNTGKCVSPYALSKRINEEYAQVYGDAYGLQTAGLRYFNVFGPRQDPAGQYAAVIPRWVATLLRGEPCRIYGDGTTSRDFCYIANVVQANLLAAVNHGDAAPPAQGVYNVACGSRTSLTELFAFIRDGLLERGLPVACKEPLYADFRKGDVKHSLADITRARTLLGYQPTHDVKEGLAEALTWYVNAARP
ncbi:MAG: SDR family oxidoreductase [Deltaproteobacteria bacterium]|nr:SDR family oxidoreductase [Deltaproteobacteria bacterium]